MRHMLGSSATLALALPVLFALGGCGGAGVEGPANPPAATGDGTTKVESAPKKTSESAELVTPDRAVDPKKLIDVVKEEVKGGEAASGGSPQNVLWLQPNTGAIKDEPLTVAIPKGLAPSLAGVVPAANPLTKAKFELGKQLYFDPRVSLDGTVSCATCHNPDKGWTDRMKTSVGIEGQVGGRNAPTVINTAFGRTMFWDGRAPSLEGQAQGPIQNPIEMGKQSYEEIIRRLRTIKGYQDQFQQVFGTEVTLDGFAKAVATFERVAALSGNSKYDKYTRDGDFKALSESEKRGMVLFGLSLSSDDEFKPGVTRAKAACTVCHSGFNFSDEQFHNLGIGWDGSKGEFADLGRWAISPIGAKNPAELGAFKTPTVRDAEKTGPYMHDGSLATLEEVVEHYDKGGTPNPSLDKEMKKLNLTASEKADLVAFMKALSGEEVKVALPTLPVGPDGKTPDPRAALEMPTPKMAQNVVHPPTAR